MILLFKGKEYNASKVIIELYINSTIPARRLRVSKTIMWKLSYCKNSEIYVFRLVKRNT